MGNTGKDYEIVSPNEVAREVRDAVVAALGDDMSIDVSSTFKDAGSNYETAVSDGTIIPITHDELKLPVAASGPEAGAATQATERAIDTADHPGGMAIVLRDLKPMLSVADIGKRLERQRMQPLPGGGLMPYREIDIVPLETGGGDLVKSAVIMVSDSQFLLPRRPGHLAIAACGAHVATGK